MGPLPRRALAAVAAVAVLAGGGWLFLASRDAPPTARLRPAPAPGERPSRRRVGRGPGRRRVRRLPGARAAGVDLGPERRRRPLPGVSGAVTIAGGAVTGAEVTVDMTRLRTDVEPRDGRMREEGLETDRFPTASFRLREPVPLGDVAGARVVELRLPGDLTLHGVTRPLDFPVQARWDGDSIQVAGGARIRRADFDLEVPSLAGYRIEDTAVVELDLTLVRKGAGPPPPHGQPRAGHSPAVAAAGSPRPADERAARPGLPRGRAAPAGPPTAAASPSSATATCSHPRRRRARPASGRQPRPAAPLAAAQTRRWPPAGGCRGAALAGCDPRHAAGRARHLGPRLGPARPPGQPPPASTDWRRRTRRRRRGSGPARRRADGGGGRGIVDRAAAAGQGTVYRAPTAGPRWGAPGRGARPRGLRRPRQRRAPRC